MFSSSDDVIARRAMRRLGTSLCGRYTLRHVIGIGGMGAVYAGVHRNGHAVAIKILHEGLASDPEIERLFRREAQLANKVGHPGVVPVIDDDVTEDGCVFLVMPMLRGETLRARAERQGRKLPIEEVLVVAHAVLEVLAAAHGKKIVHRDIKPENLFVTTSGEVKVLDFGIGRFFESTDGGSATRSGRALGTPAFMAPEQALGRLREVDGRTDLWALGATMFSLLSGRFVHEAENPTEVAVLAATRPAPALGAVVPLVSSGVRNVIDRALSFRKEARWSDAAEMDRHLLEATRTGLGLSESELPRVCAPPAVQPEDFDAVPTRVPDVRADGTSPDEPNVPTEALLGTPTRTTTGAVSAQKSPSRVASRHRKWFRAGIGIGTAAMIFVAGATVLRTAGRRGDTGSRSPVLLAESSVGGGALSLLSGVPESDAALGMYRTAARLWQDASSIDAKRMFHQSTLSAPDFAAAHLWYVLSATYVEADVRAHYASAVRYRDALTELQRKVLEALGPSMEDPSDLARTTGLLASLLKENPDAIELRLVLASHYHRIGDKARGLDTIAEVLRQAAPPSLGFYIRALLVSIDNDVASTRSALRECLDRSPTGTDCLYDLWLVESNEGECDRLEPICRRFLANAPDRPSPYKCFADALFSTDGSREAIAAAYEKLEKRAPSGDRARVEDQVNLAISEGRLADADGLATEWQRVLAQSDGTVEPTFVYSLRTDLAVELGRGQRAVKLVKEFRAVSRTWPQSTFASLDADYVSFASRAGLLTPADRRVLRDRLITSWAGASHGSAAGRWINVYVGTSWTSEEAQDAIAQMPEKAINAPQYRDAHDDYDFGRVFALAGRSEEAASFFSRAARSCRLSTDFYRTRSKFELAKLSESRKDRACELYADVVRHWGKTTPGSVTVLAARSRAYSLGCP